MPSKTILANQGINGTLANLEKFLQHVQSKSKKGFFFFERHSYRALIFYPLWPNNIISFFFQLRNRNDVSQPISFR